MNSLNSQKIVNVLIELFYYLQLCPNDFIKYNLTFYCKKINDEEFQFVNIQIFQEEIK